MAISMDGPVPHGKVRRFADVAARWKPQHCAVVGAPAGLLAEHASHDRLELRNEHRTSASELVRSETGARDHSQQRVISAEVRALLDERGRITTAVPGAV